MSLGELQRVIRLWREQQGDESENAYKSLFQYVHPLVIGAVDRAESLSTTAAGAGSNVWARASSVAPCMWREGACAEGETT